MGRIPISSTTSPADRSPVRGHHDWRWTACSYARNFKRAQCFATAREGAPMTVQAVLDEARERPGTGGVWAQT